METRRGCGVWKEVVRESEKWVVESCGLESTRRGMRFAAAGVSGTVRAVASCAPLRKHITFPLHLLAGPFGTMDVAIAREEIRVFEVRDHTVELYAGRQFFSKY